MQTSEIIEWLRNQSRMYPGGRWSYEFQQEYTRRMREAADALEQMRLENRCLLIVNEGLKARPVTKSTS